MNKDKDYLQYLEQHRLAVVKAFDDILKPILVNKGYDDSTLRCIELLCINHDKSRRDEIEFIPYRDHYFDPYYYTKNSHEYKKAWNHHQKLNPHHWQHWVVLNDLDNPKMYAIDMDFEYIIEMLCDWIAASSYYGNTAHNWYQQQKDNMILSDNTREIVEYYIDYLKELNV